LPAIQKIPFQPWIYKLSWIDEFRAFGRFIFLLDSDRKKIFGGKPVWPDWEKLRHQLGAIFSPKSPKIM
jgi:hypothetical protein